MKKLFAVCVSSVVVLLGSSSLSEAYAQVTLPSKTEIFLPKTLKKMGGGSSSVTLLKEADALKVANDSKFYQNNANKQQQYWVVYSDRANNKAYSSPNGSSVYAELAFNQRVTIAAIDYSSKRALVFEDKKVRNWPELPKYKDEYEVYGWVPMDHLLLWDSCPTDNSGIYNKALLSLNLDARDNVSEAEAKKRYLSPDGRNTQPLKLDEKIYYIMKRQGDKALLATQYTLAGAASYKVLLGWVRDISYVPWSQRSCLEPTWDEGAVEFFAGHNITADVEAGDRLATSWSFRNNSLIMKDKNEEKYHGRAANPYRIPGTFRRFPILDKKGNNYQVTSFSTSGKGKSTMDIDFDIWDITNDDLKALQKINLVIVIDGTQSMEKFYAPAKTGIEEGCKSLAGIANSKIKLGAVIYRDAKDVLKGVSYEIERLPRMVPISDPAFSEFLSTGGEYGVRSSSADKSLEESLFKGIDSGVDYFNGKEKESNIILVVGDCGNISDAVYQRELYERLVKYNVQIMCYQVRIESNAKKAVSYFAFTNQMCDIVANAIKGIYTRQRKTADFSLDGNVFSMKETKNRSHLGSVISPLNGAAMDPEELSRYMFNTISAAQTAIQNQLDLIAGAANGDWEADPDYLISRGYDPKSIKGTMSFRGWTAKRSTYKSPSGKYYDYYKPVLFLSQQELTTLVAALGKVPTKKQDRVAFVRAMVEVAAKFSGLSGQDIASLDLSQIQQMVYGLNERSEILNGRLKLNDITQPNIVSDKQFTEMLNLFERKYQRLRNINDSYQGFYEFNGAKYYWIPIEDLP